MNNDKDKYDLIIVGAGPAGLALAQCASRLKKKILIIERENVIGGCHAVRRVNGLFTEHGPRVYSSTYRVFNSLLEEMGSDFESLFVKYNFQFGTIGNNTVFSVLSWRELMIFAFEFMKLIINDNHAIDIQLRRFLILNDFKEDSMDIIERICRLTDGGGSDKYTLHQFLQLFNQQFFYSLYQPKKPNDIGLLKLWKDFLDNRGVEFSLNTQIKAINITTTGLITNDGIKNTKVIDSIDINNRRVYCEKIVFAIPPKNLYELMKTNGIAHNWGDLENFALETAYNDYLSVTFHWKDKLDLPKIYGFPRSNWGIAFVVLSDYMNFGEEDSKTVISSTVTFTDRKSVFTFKTANECETGLELTDEIYLQLLEAFPGLPKPTRITISPGVKYDKEQKQWVCVDTAYIITSNAGFLPFKNDIVDNMYNLGTHNGKSLYRFTSLESAVSNSVALSNLLYPELEERKLLKSTTVVDVVRISVIILIIILVIYLYIGANVNKNKNKIKTNK